MGKQGCPGQKDQGETSRETSKGTSESLARGLRGMRAPGEKSRGKRCVCWLISAWDTQCPACHSPDPGFLKESCRVF